jgi:hypothetical protein
MQSTAWFVVATLVLLACGETSSTPSDESANADGTAPTACSSCVQDSDCASGICAQVGGDSYCLDACPNGGGCPAGQACAVVATVAGESPRACLAPACTAPADTDAGAPSCPGFAAPGETAACKGCKQGSSGCQPNGCFGGWYCNTLTASCQAPPSCGPADAGASVDAGAVTGKIGPNGGTESALYFAILGDTRPAFIDDTNAYPTAIITKLYTDVAKRPSVPPFVVATGDYVFAKPFGTQAAAQLGKYLSARAAYPGVVFPALGNHECTGATDSNCGPAGADGVTVNYTQFMTQILGPLQKTLPYYEIDVAAVDASWTAKFLFVAANAWDAAQASWLDAAMSKPTTYTFVVRHEPALANTAPGVKPSEAIMAKHPYTLAIVGHTHTYEHPAPREIVVGNGGAPLTGSKNYGYGLVTQRPDETIQIDMIDVASGLADGSFRFALHPDGTPAP